MSYNSPFTGNVVQPTDVSFRSITLSANLQLEWPINGNATDDYAARIMQVSATTSGLELRMPPANQSSVGNDALIEMRPLSRRIGRHLKRSACAVDTDANIRQRISGKDHDPLARLIIG